MMKSSSGEKALDQQTLDILLVDDDEFFADIVANQLQDELHHKITIARGGREAKELLEKENSHFDMILTDYYMPEISGIDLLQWIHDTHLEIPVVMLTAAGSDVVAVEAMKLGAYDYVRKEQLDLQHLGVIINATNERHQFRVTKALEEERAHEIGLNELATDKVRDVLNALTPTLNSALANINGDIETRGEDLCKQLPPAQGEQLHNLLKQIQRETVTLETSIRGLLGLYRMLYAHHAEVRELDRLKREIEEKTAAA
jgi:DNA-binding response OmpR family regulator